jgi:aspartyl-tRNA(Asn)/glutamyl-tRNA(Gln) amidotransferase subunit C
MPITREQVEYVARLSRLELTEEEKGRFAGQLEAILEFVGKLNELDTAGVEPLIHVAPRQNVSRDDVPGQSLPRDEALANAPDQNEGSFKVPRIIE